MDIEIKNEDYVINTCENAIKAYIPILRDNLSGLDMSLERIKVKWNSTGADKEWYVVQLDKQIDNLRTLTNALITLFNSILNYIQNIKQTSSNSVDVVIGKSIGGHDVSTGYTTAYNAVQGVNQVGLNPTHVNEASQFEEFAVLDSSGHVIKRVKQDGISLQDFITTNGYDPSQVAVIIGKDNSAQAWLSATELMNQK